MAKRGKPLGNKRQREQAKRRKKKDKEARRESHKHPDGTFEGEPAEGEEAPNVDQQDVDQQEVDGGQAPDDPNQDPGLPDKQDSEGRE